MNPLLDQEASQLKDALAFDFKEIGADPQGRVELFREPEYDRAYAIGADFSYGIRGRDYDAAVVLDVQSEPFVQVAEAEGHWGEQFHRVLYALAVHYNHAWICGESQLGLLQLRILLRDFGYGKLYYNRDEVRRGRKLSDVLGHWAKGNDIILRKGRLAVRERRVIARSESLLQQLERFAWIPRSSKKRLASDELHDKDLVPGPSVGHDDLVRAFCYAFAMGEETPILESTPTPFAEGSFGEVLRHNDVFTEPDEEFGGQYRDPFQRPGSGRLRQQGLWP